jgi:hypothetical protein
MECATLRKWLLQQGCSIERRERIKHKRSGSSTVLVRRENRVAELPLVGSRKRLPQEVIDSIVDKLGLDRADLPGPKSRA